MAKENRGGDSWWLQVFQELIRTDVYKRSQGKLVRQITCLAIWVCVVLAAYQLHAYIKAMTREVPTAVIYGVPGLILLAGIWIGFRIVNIASFADFLIAVEAEMNKVSWPSRIELVRSSMVVIILMFGLTLVLFTYDYVLYFLLGPVLHVTE